MAQRVAVITGASSGIGKEAAKTLAGQGWRVIATGRDPQRCAAAEAEIRAASTSGDVTMLRADLALLADAARVAGEIAALTDRIDVLLNNAGGMAEKKVITSEGFEENFAGNHLGPFLLTDRLLPLLRRVAQDAPKGAVRIVNTSSNASEMIQDMPWHDLKTLADQQIGLIYCQGKLANVLFTRALAKRLAADGIVSHALHPGVIASNFFNNAGEAAQARFKTYTETLTPEQASETLVWLATAEEPGQSSGGYYYLMKPRDPNPLAYDDDAVERLWAQSQKMVAEAGI